MSHFHGTSPPLGPLVLPISSLDSPDGTAPACTAAKQCVKGGRGSLAGGVRGLRASKEGTHVGPQPTSPRKAPVWPQHLPAAPRPALQAPRPALGFVPWDPPAGPGRPEGLSGTKAYNRDRSISIYQPNITSHRVGERCTESAPLSWCAPAPAQPRKHLFFCGCDVR